MDDLPLIHPAMVDALKKRFPVPVPKLDDSDRQVWFRVGAWSVIQFLEKTSKDQQEKTRVQPEHS
jgi:hypothetical protein